MPISAKAARGVTSEQARDARARAWMFVFAVYAQKMAEGRLPSPAGRNDAKEIKNGCAAAEKYTG